MVVSTNGRLPKLQRTLTEMLLTEHVSTASGGRAERAARPRARPRRPGAVRAPGRRPRAVLRPQPADGLRPGRLHPLRPLRPLHAGRDAVLGAHASRAAAPRRASSRPTATPGSTRSASSAAAASPSARPARSTRRSSDRHDGARHARSTKTRTTCTFCGVGCQIDLNVDPETGSDRQGHLRAAVPAERGQPLREGPLRVQLRPPSRPAHRAARPRRGRRAPPGDWEDALAAAAAGLNAVRERHGAQSVGVLASARLTNEENYLIQKLARTGLGDELRPLLRMHLTRSDPLRPGQVVRQRSQHQLDPGDRGRPLPARDRLEHDRGAPGARAADQEGRARAAPRSSSPTRARSG